MRKEAGRRVVWEWLRRREVQVVHGPQITEQKRERDGPALSALLSLDDHDELAHARLNARYDHDRPKDTITCHSAR